MLDQLKDISQLLGEQPRGTGKLIGCNILDELPRLEVLNGGDDKRRNYRHNQREYNEFGSECESPFIVFQLITLFNDERQYLPSFTRLTQFSCRIAT